MGEPKLMRFAQIRPLGSVLGTSFRSPPNPSNENFRGSLANEKGEDGGNNWYLSRPAGGGGEGNARWGRVAASPLLRTTRPGSIRRRAKSSEGKEFNLHQPPTTPVFRREESSAMQTLDRRISASSDQLDTLRAPRPRAVRTRSSSRLSYERRVASSDLDEGGRRRRGEKEEKEVFTRGLHKSVRGRGSRDGGKTAYEMFLEDDGPYSRKLYPPLTPDPRRRPERRGDEEMVRGRREEECEGKVGRERRERIVYTSSQGGGHNQEELEDYDGVLPRPVRRGLLWQQKDRFFSRWKERFFILTQDYLHCFKKESSRITEMGGFIFKCKLSEVEEVSLLNKRGYLTVSLTHSKDGKLYLRRHEGIKDWFNMIQASVYESKRRRKFWVGGNPCPDQPSVEQWLLGRQPGGQVAATGGRTPAGTPYLRTREPQQQENSQDTINVNRGDGKDSNPKGINRLSLVTDLLMNETISDLALAKAKQAEDSGLDSGHNSMNTGSDSASDSNSSEREEPPITQPARPRRLDSFSLATNQRRQGGGRPPLPNMLPPATHV